MSTINFSYDPEWLDTLSAPFMTNAFIAGLCIALAAIARRSTFAAHALAHIGLPGATGAVLLGLPVSLGMGVFALGGALVIGALGKRVSEREIATGTVLAFATGFDPLRLDPDHHHRPDHRLRRVRRTAAGIVGHHLPPAAVQLAG